MRVGDVRARAGSVAAAVLRRARGGARAEALGFPDSRALLAPGERTGLAAPISLAVRDDLRRIRAAGPVVEEDADKPTDTTAEPFLESP